MPALFFQEGILLKHVASKTFSKKQSKTQIFLKSCLFGCFRRQSKRKELLMIL